MLRADSGWSSGNLVDKIEYYIDYSDKVNIDMEETIQFFDIMYNIV